MKFHIYRVLFFILALGFSVSALSADLTGQWNLQVKDQNHKTIATLTIEFTNEKATSCLGGNWLRVNVVSATTKDDNFFPVSAPLSYTIENNKLTIGRNEICDAYLELGGKFRSNEIHGDYYSLGWGTTPLGFFSLFKKN